MRGLLHVAAKAAQAAAAAEPEHLHGDTHDHHAHETAAAVSTLDLRIAAIFVIWVGAVLFGTPTLVFKQFRSENAVIPRLLRSFAGGTIVALALVHIIPEAVHELEPLMEYPVGGCTILFGILVLVLVDNSLAAFLAPEDYKQHIRDSQAARNSTGQDGASHGCGSHAEHGKAAAPQSLPEPAAQHHHHDQHKHQHQHGPASDSAADISQADIAAIKTAAQSHSHQCLRSLSATGWVSSTAGPMRNMRQYVTAYTMELGCIFHSVIIGIGVGVVTNDRQLVVTLMVALAVHQGLEALALGSVLALTSFGYMKKIAMLFLYSITTPIGIAVGISIASSYNPESVTSKAVQGTFNGVSGGMLLYIGMYQLIAEEFSREDLLVRPKLRFGMYAALLLGAACMCILGIWS